MFQHILRSIQSIQQSGIQGREEVHTATTIMYYYFVKNITISIVYDIFETHYILLANLTSIILDTDYSQWAVLAQCKTSADGQSIEYLSTRSVFTTFFQLSYTNKT